MILPLSWSFLLAVAAPAAASDSCRLIHPGEHVMGEVRSSGKLCFLVSADSSGAVQIAISQPVDLAFAATGSGSARKADGFDFGEETLTLVGRQEWRVMITAVEAVTKATRFDVTARPIPGTEAASWTEAESAAAVAKQSSDTQEIAAAMALWRNLGNTRGIARTYLRLGTAALRSGDAASARDAYDEAYRICQQNADLRCSAEASNNSGLAARRLGDIDQARTRLDEAAVGWRKLNHLEGAAITLSNLGLLLSQTGDWQAAITAYDRARRILSARNRVAHARVLNNLGLCYLSLAEHLKAQAYFQSALAHLPAGTRDAIRARLNLGRTYMLRGALERARPHLERAVSEAQSSNDRAALADALNNLGQLLLKRSQPEAASQQLEAALALYNEIRDRRGQSSTLHHLGLAAAERGDTSRAHASLEESLRIRTAIGLRDDAAASSLALAELELHGGRLALAREHAERALATIESIRAEVPGPALRASYYAGVRRVFDVLLEIIMRTPGARSAEEGLLATERGRAQALLDAVTERARDRAVPSSLMTRRSHVQQKLNWMSLRLASATDEEEPGLRRQIQLLLAEGQEVEALAQDATSGGAISRKLPGFHELVASVPAGSAVLEYHLGLRRSFLWVLEEGRLSSFVLPSSGAIRAEAETVASLFGEILERRRSPRKQLLFEQALRKLSHSLLSPLSRMQLPERLLIAADGVLHSVPLAALTVPGAKRPLGLAHDLVRIPATSYLVSGRRPRSIAAFPMTMLAIADPVFSGNDPRLAGSRREPGKSLPRLVFTDELRTISSLVPAARRRVLQGFEATPGSLRNAEPGHYAILHFSTHAIIDHEIPEMSRIALTLVDRAGRPVDGFLRPYELAQWRLDGSLVVLAACETAQGKQVLGEGVVGLASSLLYAGASQLIATVARIDDEASAKFLAHTYRHLLAASPAPTTRAVTLARRAIAASPRWADPYYWASFVVIGQPGT